MEEKIHANGKIRTAGHASVEQRFGEDLMYAQVVALCYDEKNSQSGIVPVGETRKNTPLDN